MQHVLDRADRQAGGIQQRRQQRAGALNASDLHPPAAARRQAGTDN